MTRKSCAVEMRNAILRNYLKAKKENNNIQQRTLSGFITIPLSLTEDEIPHKMEQYIENFDPHQMYTEASDYNLLNVDTIRLL